MLLDNRYQVISKLSEGAFGETFLVEDSRSPARRRLIVKRLKPIANPDQFQMVKARFEREASVLEQLAESSDQIPKVHAYFGEGDNFYLVQELIEGQTLTELLRQQQQFSEPQVIEILNSVLTVLEYIHSQRIIHRDIKPDNIMLRNKDGKCVLIDFGAIKESASTQVLDSPNTIQAGTREYMPLEQVLGRPVFASDIYSLAITAIHLLTGKNPGDMINATTGKIEWRNFAPNLTAKLAFILEKATQPLVNDRYRSADQMRAALMMENQPILPPTPPPISQIVQPPIQPIVQPAKVIIEKPAKPRSKFLVTMAILVIGVCLLGGLLLAVLMLSGKLNPFATTTDQSGQIDNSTPICQLYEYKNLTLSESGQTVASRTGQGAYFNQELNDGVMIEMVGISGGDFLMGSPANESRRAEDEGPQHQVQVAHFYIGKYEVTQAQWLAVTNLPKVKIDLQSAPTKFKGDDLPVLNVSWQEAEEFCARLSKKSGRYYRLPSEAEWEYACRGGSTTPFAFGATINTDIANYDGQIPYQSEQRGTARRSPIAVGSLTVANPVGLYDMNGNAEEWCEDSWHDNYNGAPTNGSAWNEGQESNLRVKRGGSWNDYSYICRSAFRNFASVNDHSEEVGFRIVVVPGAQPNK